MRHLLVISAFLAFVPHAFAAGTCILAVSTSLDGEFYPSYALATMNLVRSDAAEVGAVGDPNGHIEVKLSCPGEMRGKPFKLTIDAPDIALPSMIEGVLPSTKLMYTIRPTMRYRQEALLAMRQPMVTTIAYTLEVGEQRFSAAQPLNVHSLNDCPFFLEGPNGGGSGLFARDISWMFAAYANENLPRISDDLLPSASRLGVVSAWTGYQTRSVDEVYRQVFAVWALLQQRGFHYSSITTPTLPSKNVVAQYVRLLEDSLNSAEVNCIDGTVLFASVLRRIGLRPYLVLLPTHAFVCFALDESGTSLSCLETTQLGSLVPGFVLSPEEQALWKRLRPTRATVAVDNSLRNFVRAITTATTTFVNSARAALSKKESISVERRLFDNRADFTVVDLAKARELRIMPLHR